jgi:hypothetical protein
MSHICANNEYRLKETLQTDRKTSSFVSLSSICVYLNLKVVHVFGFSLKDFSFRLRANVSKVTVPWENPTPLVSFRVVFVLCSYNRRNNCTFYRCTENFTNHFQFFTRFVQCGSRRFSLDVILCYGRSTILIKDFQFYSKPSGNYYSAAVKKMISWNSTGHCYYSSEF